MEEKVEKPVDQKDDELKNEVESKAKQNNSLDEKTAVVDEDNKIVDIDTVLSKNKELSTKVDNLSKIGFGKEYIRRLIELDSSFSIGSSEDELKKELDKITDLVIKTISGIKNGIVLNLDGSRDDTASEAQKKELDESSDVFSRSYILKKETIDKVFDEVFGTINVEKNNIEINELIDFVNFKEYGTLINEIIDEEEFKEIFNENGISEEEQKQIEKIEEDVYITADGTDDIDIELLYKYLENPENVAEVLEGRIKANPDSKFLKGLLDENGKLKKDAIQERVDDFQEKRNMIDVINDLKHFKGVIYERLANDDREKFISTLTRAQQFKENKMVAVLINIISNKNAIEVTPEQLIRMHNDIKDDNEPDIENEEDLYNYYSKDSFNAKTRDKRLNKYRKNEKNKKNERFASNVSVRAKKNYYKALEIREAYENDFTPLYEKEIYLSLSRQIEETVTAGNRDGVLELLKLYIQYNDSKNPEDNKYRDILDKYINDNKDQIEEYMKLNYPEKERIFYIKSSSAEVIETKKRLKLKTIRELIDGHEFSDESENRIKNLKENVIESYTLEMLEDREKNKKNLEEIHKMLGKKPLSKADEKILIELVLATNVNAFSSTDLEDLKTLKVEEITTALEDKIIDTLKNQDLINSNEINVNLDLYEAVRKNILLWETKAEQAKGTIDYANIIKKRDSLYKSSNIYSQMLKKVKDENGNYTENGLNELKEYKESLIYADISAEIEYMDISQITEENIESYTQYLLVGASLNGKVYMDSLEMLRKLYPDLDKNNDGNFVELVYARLFGEKYANNQELIEEKYKTLKENVFDRILKGQKTEKISDEKLESYINNNIEEMDISKIDFSKSELRNFFNDSKVKFTENDEMLYHGLYRKSLSNTLINNSHDAKLIRLLSLLSIEDAMKREDILLSNANGNQRIGSLISEMLEENPELKEEVFDENGEIREDTLNKGEEFKKDSLQANLLEKIKSAFEKEGMHPRIKLKIAILAYSYVHPPKEEIDNSINDLFDKLSSRLFETLNTQERMLIQFDEKGEPILNPNNICELYNELNSRNPMDSFEQICDVEKTKYETYGVYNFANRYVNLREDDEVNDYEDLEKIENIEERTLKLVELQKIRNKEAKEKLKAETPQRRFDLIESQVAVLSESEVKKLKNKDLIAVWYNCQIKKEAQYSNGKARSKEFEKLYESDLTEVISSLREKLNQGDSLRIEKIYDVKQIQNAIQDEKSSDDVFKKLIEENKTRKVNRKDNLKKGLKLDIKHLNKKDIDENYNEIINSFWYESKIEELRMLKAFEDADNLELEFKNKFNGKSLKDSIADTYETIDKTVDNNFFGVDGQNVDEMKIGILGENGYTYTNLLKNVDFKILKEQKNIGRGEIEKIIDSQDAYDVKITKLANMYKVFSCDKVNKAESQIGMQMIKLCIEFKKTEFNELLREDKKLDIDKLLTFTNTKKYNMLGMCDKITNKMKNAENKMQLQKDNVRSLYDYYYPKEINENETEQEKQENRDNIQEILEKALEDNLITPRAKKVLEAKEPEIYTGAVTSIEAIKNTTWRGLVKRSVDLSGKAILNLPKLLKKEGREEFSHKVSDHLENGMRIIPKKTKSTVKSLAKKGKINKKEKNGLLDIFKKKPKQIGPAQDVEKSDTMSEEQGDKAQNNQTEKKDYLNSPQFQGIDNGVYQKTQETQRSQENQPEQENSGGLKKSTILDGQEIE